MVALTVVYVVVKLGPFLKETADELRAAVALPLEVHAGQSKQYVASPDGVVPLGDFRRFRRREHRIHHHAGTVRAPDAVAVLGTQAEAVRAARREIADFGLRGGAANDFLPLPIEFVHALFHDVLRRADRRLQRRRDGFPVDRQVVPGAPLEVREELVPADFLVVGRLDLIKDGDPPGSAVVVRPRDWRLPRPQLPQERQ
eukprot:scaffold803_cov310-Pinguiococcus_pyrenoidosus.AAC.193